MMSEERVARLRAWHEAALLGGRRFETVTTSVRGMDFVVPPSVYPPNSLGLADLVADEVQAGDAVLDMGTGSGVNGIVAAAMGGEVVAVDVNPDAVRCAKENAQRNGVSACFDVRLGDLFEQLESRFDLVVFDPPFRWFPARDMTERGTADENYQALTRFFDQVRDHLRQPNGRILIAFGTTGDIDYLHHLIERAGFNCEEVRRVEGEKDGFPVAYFAYRLTLQASGDMAKPL
jgi:release factor glutamine methyltransferase